MDIEALLGEMIGMLAVGGGLCLGAYSVYLGSKDRQQARDGINRERLALIDKGMDPALANLRPQSDSGYRALFWGLALAGLGLGILVGTAVGNLVGREYEKITFSSAILFSGIGMVTYYVYKLKMDAKKAV